MPARRTSKKAAQPSRKPTQTVSAAAEREPRGARRKRETRQRLLEAALSLMADKGVEGVAINEITEAADVGFGSFYNHFESKEAIYAALVDQVFEEFANSIDRMVADLSDPAEVLAVSIRHTLRRAHREPVWGRFLLREGFSARAIERGLGQRLFRDIQRGIDAGRLSTDDPFMAFLTAGGTVLTCITATFTLAPRDETQAATLDEIGFGLVDLPERAAAAVLGTLGIATAEAKEIVHRPLPVVGVESN